MTKEQAEQTARNWLQTTTPEGKKHIFSCGSLGAIIAIKGEDRKLIWADKITILNDLINQPKPPQPKNTGQYKCEKCGREFGKAFARTNHQKACKAEKTNQDA